MYPNGTVEELVLWCATVAPPTTWVSDNATHFRNSVVLKLARALGVEHRVSVDNSAWPNGTINRMVREVIHVANVMLNESGRPLVSGCDISGGTMGIEHGMAEAAESDPLPRHDGAGVPYDLYCFHRGRRRGFQFIPIEDDRSQRLVVSLVDTQDDLLAGVLQRVDADRRPYHR